MLFIWQTWESIILRKSSGSVILQERCGSLQVVPEWECRNSDVMLSLKVLRFGRSWIMGKIVSRICAPIQPLKCVLESISGVALCGCIEF